MIDYQDFVARYYPSANSARQQDVARFLDNLAEIIGETPLADALKNTQAISLAHTTKRLKSISSIFLILLA